MSTVFLAKLYTVRTLFYYYRPQTKLRKGNVFTSLCQEFCPQGGGCVCQTTPSGQTRQTAPGRQTPPWTDGQTRQTPPPGQTPPWADTLRQTPSRADTPPPADGYWSGWYASYRNVFLLRKENIKYAQIIQILDDTSLDQI